MPAFTYGAKSQKRLTVACDLVRFYQTVGRDLTAANIQWNQVMSNFEIQWKALKNRKDEDDPDVPKIAKALPIIKWTEAFQDFLNRVIGARMIPLAYVIQIDPHVPGPAPTLAPNQPHSTEHGSVEGELIARVSRTHVLFRDDNSVVYYHLEEATRGTSYAASIKPFQGGKDGRGAWKALTSQYAGKDKGKLRSNAKNNSYTPEFGRGRAIFHLRTSFHNIEMPMSPCKPVLNMCSINSQMNIPGLDSCLRRFNALIQDSKLPWQAARLTMALKARETTLRPQLPTYCPMTQL